jgi:hypothetical protein
MARTIAQPMGGGLGSVVAVQCMFKIRTTVLFCELAVGLLAVLVHN